MTRRLTVVALLSIVTTPSMSMSEYSFSNETNTICNEFVVPTGHYTSVLAPCQVTFFQANPGASAPFSCPASINRLRTYSLNLTDWIDRCVGDLPRCYSISNNTTPMMNYSIHGLGIPIPESASYMMVNCMEDKQMQILQGLKVITAVGVGLIVVALSFVVICLGIIAAAIACVFCGIRDCLRDASKNRAPHGHSRHHLSRPYSQHSHPKRLVATGRYVAVARRPQEDDRNSIEML